MQKKIAIAGSRHFRNLEVVRHIIAEQPAGVLIQTGNLGDFNQEVIRCVKERQELKRDIDLQIYSSEELGVDQANRRMLEECDEVIIGCGEGGTGALSLSILARQLKKHVTKYEDSKTSVS